jgi:hypothetical protein
MISKQWPASRAAFHRFLYAHVGHEAHGMPLTVLSTLARRDVDPWEQAAILCRLPLDKARMHLASMLDALPGQESMNGQDAMVARSAIALGLLPLLPRPAEIRALEQAAMRRTGLPTQTTPILELVIISVCLSVIVLGGWWFSRDAAREADAARDMDARAAVAVTVAPEPPAPLARTVR